MLGIFLLVVFGLPGALSVALGPGAGYPDSSKIVAIMSGATVVVALRATYIYVSRLLVERESKLGMYD